jgi:hypothetical protein
VDGPVQDSAAEAKAWVEKNTILVDAALWWAFSGLTDIHHQGHSPGKDVQNGDHGTEEAPSA